MSNEERGNELNDSNGSRRYCFQCASELNEIGLGVLHCKACDIPYLPSMSLDLKMYQVTWPNFEENAEVSDEDRSTDLLKGEEYE